MTRRDKPPFRPSIPSRPLSERILEWVGSVIALLSLAVILAAIVAR
jgi:hypothetical protein